MIIIIVGKKAEIPAGKIAGYIICLELFCK